MPGKVLIIDDIATNRIVLKVKLAAACYQVAQAASAREGIDAARALQPDLILCSAQLPDMPPEDFLTALRTHAQTAQIPIIAITARRDPTRRLALLDAGVDEVLVKPWDEHLLLARLRSLLRQAETAVEGRLREGISRALGMAESREDFAYPPRIALVAPAQEEALRWQGRLYDHISGRLEALSAKSALSDTTGRAAPDAYVLFAGSHGAEQMLHLLADLRAHTETRDSAVIVVLGGDEAQTRAAEALDRGANDAIGQPATPREIAVRLRRQIARKRRLDKMRADMASGLQAAVIDPLTGLYNRRYALPRLAAMAQDAANSSGGATGPQSPLTPGAAPGDFAAMILDIDHFKLINDRFGHAAGDAVLERVGHVLREAAGPDDLVARIGGEEFLFALPDSTPQLAQLTARRLCKTIRETAFLVPGHGRPLQITVSIGVALASDPQPQGPPADPNWRGANAVLERADQALYGAKAHGRNQVIVCAERSAA